MPSFTLKAHDTLPILEVALKNPDGTAVDLTGITDLKLHVKVSPTAVFTRDLVKQGSDTDGVVRYTWVATDWAPIEPTDPKLPNTQGLYQTTELEMEYELNTGSGRMTLPNSGYDLLVILGDVA